MKKTAAILLVIMLIGVAITGCAPDNNQYKKITISTKSFTESLIMGEMLALLIENNTYIKAERVFGLSKESAAIHQSILAGEIDIYPEYTSSAWYDILKEKKAVPHDEQFKEIKESYEKEYELKWIGLYGFNSSTTLCIRKGTAAEYTLSKISELAEAAPNLKFGASAAYLKRKDGFSDLCEFYGLKFADIVELSTEQQCQALYDKEVDVITANMTDKLIKKYKIFCLYDDKQYFQSNYCGTVINQATLKENPKLEDILSVMNGLITSEKMAELNYLVDFEGKSYKDVARDFLKKKGLI